MFLRRGAQFLLLAAFPAQSIVTEDDLSFVQLQHAVSQQVQKKENAQFEHTMGQECRAGEVVFTDVGNYCLPDGEAGYEQVNICIKKGEYYEPITHSAIEEYMKKTGAVGDIIHGGMYVGDYVPHLSALAGDYRVYGFEPDTRNYNLSLGTIQASNLQNVWVMKAGVGNETAMMEIMVTPGVREMAMIKRLDDVFPTSRPVAVMVLDVEGFELDALYGSMEIVKRWHPLIVVETGCEDKDTEQQRAQDIYAFMFSIGYSVHLELHQEWNTFFSWSE